MCVHEHFMTLKSVIWEISDDLFFHDRNIQSEAMFSELKKWSGSSLFTFTGNLEPKPSHCSCFRSPSVWYTRGQLTQASYNTLL